MRGNILIIEDEVEIAELISLYLEKEGIKTFYAKTGEEGLQKFQENKMDLLILDINLPGMDGFQVLQKIRLESTIPVMIVSARSDDSDHIMGFGIGADDFVSKPFSPKVLVARVRAHLRRNEINSIMNHNLIQFGDFTLDSEYYILKKQDREINLSPKEMEIMVLLATNPGKKISQERIYQKVWGDTYGDISTVTVHMRRIRKKIEEDSANPKYFKTAHGFGYYFEGDMQ
ncbi:MAG: response regulator transcription factor [Spirochaetales bacterium]|nr:response regulator transcription factor [Spirochaetales bacterium]